MGHEPSVWMKAKRWHTYKGRSIEEGDFYLADSDMVETIEIIGYAQRDSAPPRAIRSAAPSSDPIAATPGVLSAPPAPESTPVPMHEPPIEAPHSYREPDPIDEDDDDRPGPVMPETPPPPAVAPAPPPPMPRPTRPPTRTPPSPIVRKARRVP